MANREKIGSFAEVSCFASGARIKRRIRQARVIIAEPMNEKNGIIMAFPTSVTIVILLLMARSFF